MASSIGIYVRCGGVIVGASRVDRMINFCTLLRVLSDITGLSLVQYSFKVSSIYRDGNVSASVPIKNTRDLRFFFDPSANLNAVELVVESEILVPPIAPHNPGLRIGSGHGRGMNTNDFPSVRLFGVNHPSNHESSEKGSNMNVPFNSIGIPSCGLNDVNSDILKVGMIFRDKEHLQTVVKDYSLRHARREYRVVESTPTICKIVCKQHISSDIPCLSSPYCRWCLCAEFIEKHSCWKITALGPPHSCLMESQILVPPQAPHNPGFRVGSGHGRCMDINGVRSGNTNDLPRGRCFNLIGIPIGGLYDVNSGILKMGMIFRDKEHFLTVAKDYSVRHARREYKVVESTPTMCKIVCKQHISSGVPCLSSLYCRWSLCAEFTEKHSRWEITELGQHSCVMDLKNQLIGDIETFVRLDPAYEATNIGRRALDKFSYVVTYKEAGKVLKRARENVFGTWESSCQHLPKFIAALQKYNPGTVVEWCHKDLNDGVVHTLGYVFWAFKPCIEAYKHCRQVLTVGGTPLYTKYKHKLLIANALDADLKILPVAYAIVDEENFQSWYWFLQMLAAHVVREADGVCLISDRHEDILKAVESVPVFHPPRGAHCYCLRGVYSDFYTQFKDERLKGLFIAAGKSLTTKYFQSMMKEIESLNKDAHEYLAAIEPSKWTLCYDEGWRFGVLTTNISEAFNSVLKGIRRLPVTAIVGTTFTQSKNIFLQREVIARKLQQKNQSWPDTILSRLDKEQRLGSKHHVVPYSSSRQTASVTAPEEGSKRHRTYTVVLTERKCSCGQWKLDCIPCSHVLQVCRQFGVNPAMYVPHCYSTNAYVSTYSSGIFEPLPDVEKWDEPCFQLKHDPDRRISTRAERQSQAHDRAGTSHQGSASRSGVTIS